MKIRVDPTVDGPALAALILRTLTRVDHVSHRLPPELAREVRVLLGDIALALYPEPLPALAIPPAIPLVIGRDVLAYVGDTEIESPEMLLRTWAQPKTGMQIAVSSDLTRHGVLLHASVSYPKHNPSWRVVRDVKDRLFGDVDAMMLLPKEEDYINVHQHTFHLWQVPTRWAIQ